MKRSYVLLLAAFLVASVAGSVGAISFTNVEDLGVTLSKGDGNVFDSYSWQHETPDDFSVPPDTVNEATLTIEASYVTGDNDLVSVEGQVVGTLETETYNWNWFWVEIDNPNSTSVYDISSIFSSWNVGDVLDVTVNSIEWLSCNSLTLKKSTLNLDYENGNPSAPVPEPATMLLLGSGLICMASFSRKKFQK